MSASTRPRSGRIPAAIEYSSVSRSELYKLAAANPGLFKKLGKSVIVDFDILDRIIDGLPNAKIKAARRNPLAAARTAERDAATSSSEVA